MVSQLTDREIIELRTQLQGASGRITDQLAKILADMPPAARATTFEFISSGAIVGAGIIADKLLSATLSGAVPTSSFRMIGQIIRDSEVALNDAHLKEKLGL